jgi:hypothetical protein
MARLTQSEFMAKLKTFIGDRTDDDAISFIEDCKDTITDDKDEWKQKYDDVVKEKEELDKTWRQKYTERFFSSDSHNETQPQDNHDNNRKTNPATIGGKEEPDEELLKIEQAEKVRIDDLFKPADS